MNQFIKKGRLPVGFRVLASGLFLSLLAACGYLGAAGEDRPSVDVPVSYTVLPTSGDAGAAMADVRQRLKSERAQAIALLDEVIAHPDTDAATRQSALTQKAQIAHRLEMEAQVEAVLLQMGIDGEAVAGETGLTIVAPAQDAADEQTRLRLTHAACSQTGVDASDLKIILVKK